MSRCRNASISRAGLLSQGKVLASVIACGLAVITLLPGCSWFSKHDENPSPGSAQDAVLTEGSAEPEGGLGAIEGAPGPGSDQATEGNFEGEGGSASPPGGASNQEGGETGSGDSAGAEQAPRDPFLAAVESIRAGPAEYARALRQLDEALSQNPRLAEAYYDKGVILQQQGELSRAIEVYRKALEIKPTLAPAAANLATIYRNQGQASLSIEVLDAALAVSPDSALLRRHRALSLERMGRTSEAVEEIRKILKKNAIDVDAFISLGCMYLRQGDYEMARLVFEKALQSVPDAGENAYVHHNLGVAFLGLGDRRASAEFDSALEAKPDLVPALVNRAYLYLGIQRFAEAELLLKRAVDVDPENVVARVDLGVALRGLEKYDDAAVQFEAALKLDPDNPTVLLNYAILLDDYKRDYLAAIDVYERLKLTTKSEAQLKKVEKYIRIAKLNQQREERRRKRERERAKQQQEAGPTPQPGSSTSSGAGGSEVDGGTAQGGAGSGGSRGGDGSETGDGETGEAGN